MDKIEQFRILKEIFSLKETKKQLLKDIDEENSRVTKLRDRKQDSLDNLNDLTEQLKQSKSELLNIENETNQLASMKERKSQQLDNLSDEAQISSMQNELNNIEEKLNFLEEKGLVLLEGIDGLEEEITKINEFLNGIDETIKEIQAEVKFVEDNMNKEIEILKDRFLNLKSQLTAEFISVFEKINKRDFPKSSFTRLNNLACEYCGMLTERSLLVEIDSNLRPTTCKGCGRLILPSRS